VNDVEPGIVVVCLAWHTRVSSAARAALIDPLSKFAAVDVATWDGVHVPAGAAASRRPLVFVQAPPPPELASRDGVRVAWVPMEDDARRFTADWWSAWPPTLRVVAYSRAVAERAERAHLPTHRVRFYPDPSGVEEARWDGGTVLYYWNRCGLFGPRTLRRICRAIQARTLLFRDQVDPAVSPQAIYRADDGALGLPVVHLPGFVSGSEYLASIAPANVVLAPRACEGIGMVMLEAMSRGCAVIALDAPTANEYIEHGVNGLLLRAAPRGLTAERIVRVALRLLGVITPIERPNPDLVPSLRQDWREIVSASLPALGRAARRAVIDGHARWVARLPRLAEFLLEW
jgi:Glycosyl transferases group 1